MDLFGYSLIWVCIIGLCLGSFYNVVILRSLSNESIVFPPSKCPKCGHKLYFWHNIPVISYILLRGKCYFCKEKISIQYPLIEIITMVGFALAFLKFGLSWTTLFILFWLSGLIIITSTDIKEKVVDCNIAIAMAIAGVVYNFISEGWHGVLFSILGFLAGFVLLEIISRIGYVFVKSRAMGEADSYVAGVIGAIFTLKGFLPVLFYSFIFSMVFIIPVFLYNKMKFKQFSALFSLLTFIFSAIIYKFYIQNIIIFLFLVVSGICSVRITIKDMRKTEKNTYIPFVPALAAGIIYGFYLM